VTSLTTTARVATGPTSSSTCAGDLPALTTTDPQYWAEVLSHLTSQERCHFGQQARALVVHSAFSGMNSHIRVMSELGFVCVDVASAEPKDTAKTFARLNGTMVAAHHFNDIKHLTDGGWCCCCLKRCVISSDAPDLYIGGFSCQPWSPMRSGVKSRQQVTLEKHPLFPAVKEQIRYLRTVQPTLALLENGSGIQQQSEYDGETLTGLQWLRQQLQDLFHIEWVEMDLLPWLNMRRRRTWIYLLRLDSGTPDLLRQACRLALALQERRAQHPQAQLQAAMFTPGSSEFLSHVGAGMAGASAPRHENDELASSQPTTLQEGKKEPAWIKQLNEQREVWRQAGVAGHDTRPLAQAQLRGMSAQRRERAILEAHLIQACLGRHGSPDNPQHIALAKEGLFRDPSRNWRSTRQVPRSLRTGLAASQPSTNACQTACTSSRVYSYVHDRWVLPVEILRALGW